MYYGCFLQPPSLPDHMVPRIGMLFTSVEQAFEMFRSYAEASGFAITWGWRKLNAREILCSMSGSSNFSGCDQHRARSKRSRKTGCRVYMKLRYKRDVQGNQNGNVLIQKINLHHNHPLLIPQEYPS